MLCFQAIFAQASEMPAFTPLRDKVRPTIENDELLTSTGE